MQFLISKVPGRILDHPPKSPDMNPIEKIWSILKQKVEKKCPKNKQELIQFINEGWNSLSLETISKLIDFAHYEILQLVIENQGNFQRSHKIPDDFKWINIFKQVNLEDVKEDSIEEDSIEEEINLYHDDDEGDEDIIENQSNKMEMENEKC